MPALSKRFREFLIEKFIFLNGLIAVLVVAFIFVFLLRNSLPIFSKVNFVKFITGQKWYPLSAEFEILPLILGSLLVTIGAVAIAIPLGVATAIYIAEVVPRALREVLKPMVEVLAAIPSVVLGFLGLMLLAPWISNIFHLPTGLTALTGSLMLAFMALPTIVSISEDAITSVPRDYRHGSLALGASHWQTIRNVVLPTARSGIVAAIMLGIGRAIGETMTVMMVTGNAAVIPHSFLQPVRTMTATIAVEMGETVHYSDHYYALFAVGLVLFLITFAVNLVADLALRRGRR